MRRTNSAFNIEILGVNQIGDSAYNSLATAGRSLPWLQDTREEAAWTRWQVVYRDLRILNARNEVFAIYNLTEHDLGLATNRAALKQLFLKAAQVVDSDADGLPDDWEQRYLDGLSANATDDPDRDGADNATEFAFGTYPTSAASTYPLRMLRAAGGPSRTVTFTFRRRAGAWLDYAIETSGDLKDWLPIQPDTWSVSSPRNLFDGTGTEEVTGVWMGSDLNGGSFVRVRATLFHAEVRAGAPLTYESAP